jgi:GTP:adenosylcobinamide-phosphate guanylyltransferase
MEDINSAKNVNEWLTVTVTSFSYKKGIPEDPSGNGGGFVFDCRAVHNPGRYEEYKHLTGMDQPVIDFLERDGEILTFLSHVDALVDASVARYVKRGFTSLCVHFGCTGGQHRSVYSAEHVARHVSETFGVRVVLNHREQAVTRIFEPRTLTAMIFAAGLGTRLRPLTDTMPKALVAVKGIPMLGRVIGKLKAEGYRRIVVNVHHFPEQIREYLKQENYFGLDIAISDESDQLLDTGGGLQHAAPLLTAKDEMPVLVHNVDILSDCSLADLMKVHLTHADRDATLLVSERQTQRYLLFDADNRLCGWIHKGTGQTKPEGFVYEEGKYQEYAFSGIQVVSPRLLKRLPKGKYSIVDYYLSHCHETKVYAHAVPGLRLLDIGKPDTLQLAETF